MTESLSIFRKKLGLCLANTSSNTPSTCLGKSSVIPPTSRGLFGPPDPQQATGLVREIELKNALNFGKRFNFDIVTGEPFPFSSAKRRRIRSESDQSLPSSSPSQQSSSHSDEENAVEQEEILTEDEEEGYIWAETYPSDYFLEEEQTQKQQHQMILRFPPVSLLLARRRSSSSMATEDMNQTEIKMQKPRISDDPISSVHHLQKSRLHDHDHRDPHQPSARKTALASVASTSSLYTKPNHPHPLLVLMKTNKKKTKKPSSRNNPKITEYLHMQRKLEKRNKSNGGKMKKEMDAIHKSGTGLSETIN